MEGKTYNLTIFLMKETIIDFKSCVKQNLPIYYSKIKEECGIDGIIAIAKSNANQPRWKEFLQEFCHDDLIVDDNVSNKAVMLVRIKGRIFAITFGYGRAFLREDNIERNFGFITALNMIDPQKIRSINTATVEDMVVHIQKQSSYSTGQEEFSLNTINDILLSVTGKAQDSLNANKVSGKDSLAVSVEMSPIELREKLERYLNYYENENYKNMGFSWIDNVQEIRDVVIKECLDLELVEKIKQQNYENIYVSPPDTINWSDIKGFAFSGMGKNMDDIENYQDDIDFSTYLNAIQKNSNVLQKLKRDKLYGLNSADIVMTISSVFSSLIAQVEYEKNTYILCDGRWFQIEKNFYDNVIAYVSQIPISKVDLPSCKRGENEEEYNKRVANTSSCFALMDRKLVGVDGGNRKIEACDIFTKDKQFIHVKNKCRSSQLSHLFAQGRVSAECFISDEEYRAQISQLLDEKFEKKIFDYKIKPKANEYEVIYVIIDEKTGKIENRLPFFSLVNLMTTVQQLDRMHMKYSVKMVEKE